MKKISIIKEILKTKSTYLIFILILIGMASDLLIPKLLSNIIDNGILNKDLNTIYLSSATILGLALLSIIVSFFSIIFSIKLSFNISTNLGNKIFEKTLFLNFEKLESLATGSLLTRITNDTFKVSNAILNGLIIAIKFPFVNILDETSSPPFNNIKNNNKLINIEIIGVIKLRNITPFKTLVFK